MARERIALLELEELGRRLEQSSTHDARSTSPSLDRKSMTSRYIWCLRKELEAARKRTKEVEKQLAEKAATAMDAVEQAQHQFSPRRLPWMQRAVLSPVGKLAGALVTEAKAAREKSVLVEQLVHEVVGAAAMEEELDKVPAHGNLYSAGKSRIGSPLRELGLMYALNPQLGEQAHVHAGIHGIDSLVSKVAEVTRQLELKEPVVSGLQAELSHVKEGQGASLLRDVTTNEVKANLEPSKEAQCKEQEITITELQNRLSALQEENERLAVQLAASAREHESEVETTPTQLRRVREPVANVAADEEEAAVVAKLQGQTDDRAFRAALVPAPSADDHPRMAASVPFKASCGLDVVMTEPPFADGPQGCHSNFAASGRTNHDGGMRSAVRDDSEIGLKVRAHGRGNVFHLVASPAGAEVAGPASARSATRFASEQPLPCTTCGVTACIGGRQEEALHAGICNEVEALKDERHVSHCRKTLERGWWSVGPKLLGSIALIGVVGLSMVYSPVRQSIPSLSPVQNGYLQQSYGPMGTPDSVPVNTSIATRLASATEDVVGLANVPLPFGTKTFKGFGPEVSMDSAAFEQAQTVLGHPQYAGSTVPDWLLTGATQVDKALERHLLDIDGTAGFAGKDKMATGPNAIAAGEPKNLASVLEALSVKHPAKTPSGSPVVATSRSLPITSTAEADLPELAVDAPVIMQHAEMAQTVESSVAGRASSVIENMVVAGSSSFALRPEQNTSSKKKSGALEPKVADASSDDGFPVKQPSAEAFEALTFTTSPAAVDHVVNKSIADTAAVGAEPKRPCVRKTPTQDGRPAPPQTTALPNVSASVKEDYKIQNLTGTSGTSHAAELLTVDASTLGATMSSSATQAMDVNSAQGHIALPGQHLANESAGKPFLVPTLVNHESTMEVHPVTEASIAKEFAPLSSGSMHSENVSASRSSQKVDGILVDMEMRKDAEAVSAAYGSVAQDTVSAADEGLGGKASVGKASGDMGSRVTGVLEVRQRNVAPASSSAAAGIYSTGGVQSSAEKVMDSLHWAGLSLCGTVTAAVSALLWRDRSLHRQARWKSVWAVGPDEGVPRGY